MMDILKFKRDRYDANNNIPKSFLPQQRDEQDRELLQQVLLLADVSCVILYNKYQRNEINQREDKKGQPAYTYIDHLVAGLRIRLFW